MYTFYIDIVIILTIDNSMNKKEKTWSVEQRLAYIDFRLKWYGKLNRADLKDHFKISVPQASLDIAEYIALAPMNIAYDKRAKTYIRKDSFNEYYPESSSAKTFLSELLTNTELSRPSQSICSVIPTFERSVGDSVTSKIVEAIENTLVVEIKYQSMTKEEPSIRRICPTKLVFTGSRWHIRAFCFKRECYLDFLLARILDVSLVGNSTTEIPKDKDWETVVTLIIEPANGLTASQKAIIEYDYGMQNHILEMKCRKAFLFYLLKKYRFLNPWRNPQQQEVELKNIDEIKKQLTDREISVLSDSIGDRV